MGSLCLMRDVESPETIAERISQYGWLPPEQKRLVIAPALWKGLGVSARQRDPLSLKSDRLDRH